MKSKHSPNPSETSSIGSWLSIDDVIKVKRVEGEQQVNGSGVTHTHTNNNDGEFSYLLSALFNILIHRKLFH